MNAKELLKDVFRLAVKLSGLYFIVIGLKGLDTPAFMDVTILKGDDVNDVISTLLPVGFNLAVGWWLLGSGWLSRRAFPEASAGAKRVSALTRQPTPPPEPPEPPAANDLLTAEKKLAALVGKPAPDGKSR